MRDHVVATKNDKAPNFDAIFPSNVDTRKLSRIEFSYEFVTGRMSDSLLRPASPTLCHPLH